MAEIKFYLRTSGFRVPQSTLLSDFMVVKSDTSVFNKFFEETSSGLQAVKNPR